MQGNKVLDERADNEWQDHFFGFGLNFEQENEQPGKFSRHIGVLVESKCAHYGAVFYYQNVRTWAYKIKTSNKSIPFCRYSCMRAGQKKHEEEHARRIAARTARRMEKAAKKKAGEATGT